MKRATAGSVGGTSGMPSLQPCSMAKSVQALESSSPISTTSKLSRSAISGISNSFQTKGLRWSAALALVAGRSVRPHLRGKSSESRLDPLLQLLGIQAANRMLHYDQVWIHLPGLGLCGDQRPKRLG